MAYDIIHIAGKPHVLIPLHEYTAMKNSDAESELPDEILQKITMDSENAIKTIRKYRGLTQGDLADAAGISRPYLTEIETGRKDGSIRAMKAIAQALNVSLDKLAS